MELKGNINIINQYNRKKYLLSQNNEKTSEDTNEINEEIN